MKKICIFLINVYKKTLSPIIGNSCRFTPSCSEYTKQAIEKYGFFKGTGRGIIRILKCNPFSKGGYDPLK